MMDVPSGSEFGPGYQLGAYALLERLGSGGQAVVWSAWDKNNERVVAIKLVPTSGSDSQTDIYTFGRETDIIARLNHPNILPIYDFGTTSKSAYLAMQYLPLGSVEGLLRSGPIPRSDVLRLAAQIVSALDYIHTQGIVHRDLKPSNILLDSQKRAYLTDFGLARPLTATTQAFHTGRGTAPYAPPEQHTKTQVTLKSDIYSLGIMLFEMLAGSLPWSGDRALAIMQMDRGEELPDPRDTNPSLPAALAGALRALTAADPAERPDSAVEAFGLVAAALQGDQGHEDTRSSESVLALEDALRQAAPPPRDDEKLVVEEAQYLLQYATADWNPRNNEFRLGLTDFMLVDVVYAQAERYGVVPNDYTSGIMLRGALTHGHHVDFWWQMLTDPQSRLEVAEQAVVNESLAASGRALVRVLGEPAQVFPWETLTSLTVARLIDLATASEDSALRRMALNVLERAVEPTESWREAALTPEGDSKLARLSLGEGPEAMQAARLIGQMHSETAVQALLRPQDEAETARSLAALLEVQRVAGSLPPLVPITVRLRILAERAKQQVLEDPATLSWPRSLVGLTVGALITLMMSIGVFAQPNTQVRDILIQPYPVSGVVTIVEADDASLDRYGDWDEWPRSLHAELIGRLTEAGAQAIVMDVVFAAEKPDDALLADAIRRAGNVVQPMAGRGDALLDTPGTVRYEGSLQPRPDLQAVSAAVGHVNILLDVDGYVRQVPLTVAIEGERYPSMALAAVQVYLGADMDAAPTVTDSHVWAAGRRIPVSPWGEMTVNYAGPPARPDARTFQAVSYQDVLDGKFEPGVFENKIVLVGVTATAEPDRHLTPISRGRPMYGVEIQANAVETIWSNRFISYLGSLPRVGILLLLGLLTGMFCAHPLKGLAFASGEAALYFVASSVLFDRTGVMLDLLYPFVTIVLSYGAVMVYRRFIEARRRTVVRQSGP